MGWCFWVDRGGTFTDLIGRDPEGRLHVRKVLSEQAVSGDPAVSAMVAMLDSASSGVDLGDVDEVRLGTTVATNALLEGCGSPLLLLTNAGLRDQLWIGDQHRDDGRHRRVSRTRLLRQHLAHMQPPLWIATDQIGEGAPPINPEAPTHRKALANIVPACRAGRSTNRIGSTRLVA